MKQFVSLNDAVLVKLTEAGERRWTESWRKTYSEGVPDAIRKAATLPDGRVRFHLWNLMHVFGPDCFMGSSRLPFVGNAVEVEAEIDKLPAETKDLTEPAGETRPKDWTQEPRPGPYETQPIAWDDIVACPSCSFQTRRGCWVCRQTGKMPQYAAWAYIAHDRTEPEA